jgi:ATP phosphoribosyltransferase
VITLALPSKGALYEGTLSLFAQCGMRVQRQGRGRGYWGAVKHLPELRVQFLRAEEIPLRVDSGDVLLGVSGMDLHREYCSGTDSSHVAIKSLGFGYARLVVAVPSVWIDVDTMEDLAEIATTLRIERGRGLRVGTKFVQLTRELFARHLIRDYVLVDSRGATEGMPAAGAADVIVDLTSSGATLIENDLKELQDGTAIESEACLILHSNPAAWDASSLNVLEQVVACLEAGLRAKNRRLIHFTIPGSSLTEVSQHLSTSLGCEAGWEPTISVDLADASDAPTWAGIVSPAASVYAAVKYLKQMGAANLSVVRPELMFGEAVDSYDAFRQLLRHKELPAR